MEQIKLMLSAENKFYDRKESYLTRYYCITSKLTAFEKFITFSFQVPISTLFMFFILNFPNEPTSASLTGRIISLVGDSIN